MSSRKKYEKPAKMPKNICMLLQFLKMILNQNWQNCIRKNVTWFCITSPWKQFSNVRFAAIYFAICICKKITNYVYIWVEKITEYHILFSSNIYYVNYILCTLFSMTYKIWSWLFHFYSINPWITNIENQLRSLRKLLLIISLKETSKHFSWL